MLRRNGWGSRAIGAATLALACLGRGAMGQELVVNGGFELGSGEDNVFYVMPPGSGELTGWTILDSVGRVGPFWSTWCDAKSLHLNNSQGPGAIEQTVVVPAAGAYELQFRMAGHPYGSPTIRTLRIQFLVGSTTIQERTFEFDVLGYYANFMGWRAESFAANLPAGPVTLRLSSLSPGYAGPALDCISLRGTTPICVADFDDGSGTGTRDGGVGIEDLLFYLGVYDLGATAADVDDGSGTGTRDGGVGIEDLLYYLQRYDAGC